MAETSESDDMAEHERLEEYLRALHQGDDAAQVRLVEEYPGLKKEFMLLEQLEAFAVPIQESARSLETRIVSGDHKSGNESAEDEDSWRRTELESSSEYDSLIDQNFGPYRLQRVIGRGGMGVVYEAEQPGLQRRIALKVMLSGTLASREELRRFQTEAKATAKLQHPGIVSIHEIGEHAGQSYYTMDYLEGGTLADRLKNGPMNAIQAARILKQIAAAVSCLHESHLVHRDLKPSNILFDHHGRPLISDFGLVKAFEHDATQTQTGHILGTAAYMAPEQARGAAREITERTDIYALGAILYEMLTGRPPFREASQLETILQVLEGEATLPRRLNRQAPHELELICLKCLRKNPDERFPSAAEVQAELERFLQGEALQTRGRSLATTTRYAIRRMPALLAHLVAIAVCSLILLVRSLQDTEAYSHFGELMVTLFVWAAVSCGLQALLSSSRTEEIAKLCWLLIDPVLLTFLIHWGEPPRGDLLCGYIVLIATSGLWLRERYVIAAAVTSAVGYFVLLFLHAEMLMAFNHVPIIILLIFTATLVTGFQVQRLRKLSSYFE